MKIKIETVPFEFISSAAITAQKLPAEVVLYWARNPELLLSHLRKESFDLVTHINAEPYILPALAETDWQSLWKKGMIERPWKDTFQDNVPLRHPPTPAIEVYASQIHAPLFFDELVEEFGGIESLKECAFTYGQIAALAGRHRSRKQGNGFTILDYSQSNNLPMVRRDGELTFVCLNSRHDHGKRRPWATWFKGIRDKHFTGTILIKQRLQETIPHL